MTSLLSKLAVVRDALVAVSGLRVYHFWRPRLPPPYCIWGEDGEDASMQADDHKTEQEITGYVDYYTLRDMDAKVDAIQAALDGITSRPFGWALDSVQYEDETKLIHYQWTWRIS